MEDHEIVATTRTDEGNSVTCECGWDSGCFEFLGSAKLRYYEHLGEMP